MLFLSSERRRCRRLDSHRSGNLVRSDRSARAAVPRAPLKREAAPSAYLTASRAPRSIAAAALPQPSRRPKLFCVLRARAATPEVARTRSERALVLPGGGARAEGVSGGVIDCLRFSRGLAGGGAFAPYDAARARACDGRRRVDRWGALHATVGPHAVLREATPDMLVDALRASARFPWRSIRWHFRPPTVAAGNGTLTAA
jgi:hypothetical protein